MKKAYVDRYGRINMEEKIAIVGTGANGSCVAADLALAGYDTTLIDQWPEHVETMQNQGLRIILPQEEIDVEVDANHLCDRYIWCVLRSPTVKIPLKKC